MSDINRQLLIHTTKEGSKIALVENKILVEYQENKTDENFVVGDIYFGKVKKILPGLNASFIDVGYSKDGFLHYNDLGMEIKTFNNFTYKACKNKLSFSKLKYFKYLPSIPKTGKISEILKVGDKVMTQIVKEPISSKGPRLTSEITIPGRYLVLMPFNNSISISRKIKNTTEKTRLKRLLQQMRPDNFGLIVRTIAQDKTDKELFEDLRSLVKKWDIIFENLKKNKTKLLSEIDRKFSVIRDILNDSFNDIWVDDKNTYNTLKSYLMSIAPKYIGILKIYKGKQTLFEYHGIDKQVNSQFGKIVNTGKGTYLVIENTEAMHVIDVNSGIKRNRSGEQENNALDTNIDAGTEIARQLRLRDIGGIIVIDFIDMKIAANRKAVFEHMKKEMAKDRAKHSILSISKFGLMQITRQRVRPATDINVTKKCSVCRGSGEAKETILIIDDIQVGLKSVMNKKIGTFFIILVVHPFIAAYLRRGIFSIKTRWSLKYKKIIILKSDKKLSLNDFEVLNGKGKILSD